MGEGLYKRRKGSKDGSADGRKSGSTDHAGSEVTRFLLTVCFIKSVFLFYFFCNEVI